MQDSRAGEGWADETQPPASGARQTIFALGSDVTRDNRLSQSPWAPKAELPLSRTRGTERKWSETPEALWPLERMERGPWDPLKCLTLHPSYFMGGFHPQREVQVSLPKRERWFGMAPGRPSGTICLNSAISPALPPTRHPVRVLPFSHSICHIQWPYITHTGTPVTFNGSASLTHTLGVLVCLTSLECRLHEGGIPAWESSLSTPVPRAVSGRQAQSVCGVSEGTGSVWLQLSA